MIHGAVGSVATQLAHDAGARVIGTGLASVRDVALDHGVDTFVDLAAGPLEDATVGQTSASSRPTGRS